MTRPQDKAKWEFLPDIFGDVESIADALVIREQGLFLLSDADGRVQAGNSRGLGLYFGDTRHLSTYDFQIGGAEPVVLLSSADSGFYEEQVLGNRKAVLPDGSPVGRCTVEFRRQRFVATGLQETLQVTNYNPFAVSLRVTYDLDADFADIFEVRGHPRQAIGTRTEPSADDRTITYRYFGVDGILRQTRVVFDQAPDEITPHHVAFDISLEPHEVVERTLQVQIHSADTGAPRRASQAVHEMAQERDRWKSQFASVDTDNELFNAVLGRSLTDLRSLLTRDSRGHQYFAAGTPWFDTLFGRDSIITALQVLSFHPEAARDCLEILATYQGQNVDIYHAEEPGKILHEMRQDELSSIGELPYKRYYGSVDSTPLFLLLASEYDRWTDDRETLEKLRPAVHAALHWIRKFGGTEADGYLRYSTTTLRGLRNQGWKDSENGVVYEDGHYCSGPIALAEVQGYLYAAYRSAAGMLTKLGETQEAASLGEQAEKLQQQFISDFWLEDEGMLAFCLDGEGRPSKAMSSNAGQVLLSGVLDAGHAQQLRGRLMANDMFSGWGIRTLTSDCAAFNPVGYHVGSVWPHDNAMIALGFKRYGFDDEVNEVATALFDAACAFPYYRLPELFGGQARSSHQPPVPYPVACRPQAWASGATLHLVQSMLGIVPDATSGRLHVVNPHLPYWLNRVHIRGIRVGDGRANLAFIREHGATQLHVEESEGLEVVEANAWPSHS